MYYCCWPCVCDARLYPRRYENDNASEGPQQFRFAVIGNMRSPEKLHDTFVQPARFRNWPGEGAPEVIAMPTARSKARQ